MQRHAIEVVPQIVQIILPTVDAPIVLRHVLLDVRQIAITTVRPHVSHIVMVNVMTPVEEVVGQRARGRHALDVQVHAITVVTKHAHMLAVVIASLRVYVVRNNP